MPTMTSTAVAIVHHEEEEDDDDEEENMSTASSQVQSPTQIEDVLLMAASRSANPSLCPLVPHLLLYVHWFLTPHSMSIGSSLPSLLFSVQEKK